MITLPDYPSPAAASPALVDFGAFLTPSLGGPVQRVERMGSRFRIACQMPPMKNPDLGRKWISKLIQGKQEGARMAWPLQGFDPGSPGSPFVAGAGQSGRVVGIGGATPYYTYREGQFFSIETNGRHYLYMNTAEAFTDAAGYAPVHIEPMLRVSPNHLDPCHVGKPMVEGFIMGDAFGWEMALANFVGMSFDLTEIE